MITERLALALIVAMLGAMACLGSRVSTLDAGHDAPTDVQHGCEVAAVRCSRCHSIDKVTNTRVAAPAQWATYVRRMRLMPASAIALEDELPIVRCLVHRSFGAAGLAALRSEEAR